MAVQEASQKHRKLPYRHQLTVLCCIFVLSCCFLFQRELLFVMHADFFSQLYFNQLQFAVRQNGMAAASLHLHHIAHMHGRSTPSTTVRPVPEITTHTSSRFMWLW